jgi:hypothetical protein
MGPRPDPAAGTAPAGSTCRSAWATRSRRWWAPARANWWWPTRPRSTSSRCCRGADDQRSRRAGSARVIVSERSNFPTDLYIAEALAASAAARCSWPSRRHRRRWTRTRAVLMLTHVNYRTGRMHDMAASPAPRTPPARWRCGTWRTAPARCRWTWPRRRRLRRGLRLQVPQRRPRRAGLRVGAPAPCRPLLAAAGRLDGAMRRRSPSRPATAGAGITRYLCGTPPVLSAWRRWNAASTPCWPPSRWAAWPRCAPSRWR